MKKFAVGCLSVCIAAFCIAMVALGVFKFLGMTLPYQSYPRTEARIVKVETRAVHPGADLVEYESSVQLEYFGIDENNRKLLYLTAMKK